jgi:hypothetical protein
MSEQWHWRYENADGTAHGDTASPDFPTQADAESWIGEQWRSLLESGIEQVTLLEQERVVYGPMGLRPDA